MSALKRELFPPPVATPPHEAAAAPRPAPGSLPPIPRAPPRAPPLAPTAGRASYGGTINIRDFSSASARAGDGGGPTSWAARGGAAAGVATGDDDDGRAAAAAVVPRRTGMRLDGREEEEVDGAADAADDGATAGKGGTGVVLAGSVATTVAAANDLLDGDVNRARPSSGVQHAAVAGTAATSDAPATMRGIPSTLNRCETEGSGGSPCVTSQMGASEATEAAGDAIGAVTVDGGVGMAKMGERNASERSELTTELFDPMLSRPPPALLILPPGLPAVGAGMGGGGSAGERGAVAALAAAAAAASAAAAAADGASSGGDALCEPLPPRGGVPAAAIGGDADAIDGGSGGSINPRECNGVQGREMLLAAAAPATAAAGAAVMSLPSLGAGEHAGGSAKPNGSGCVGGAEAARAGRAIVAAAEVAAPFGGGVCAIDASTLQAGPPAAAVSPASSDRAVAPSTPAARSFSSIRSNSSTRAAQSCIAISACESSAPPRTRPRRSASLARSVRLRIVVACRCI